MRSTKDAHDITLSACGTLICIIFTNMHALVWLADRMLMSCSCILFHGSIGTETCGTSTQDRCLLLKVSPHAERTLLGKCLAWLYVSALWTLGTCLLSSIDPSTLISLNLVREKVKGTAHLKKKKRFHPFSAHQAVDRWYFPIHAAVLGFRGWREFHPVDEYGGHTLQCKKNNRKRRT